MKKAVLILMVIGIICITGCKFTDSKEDETIESIEVNQKIVLIYRYINYAEEPQYRGFYVNNNGDKIEFDFSEIAERLRKNKEKDAPHYISNEYMYQLLTEDEEVGGEEYLTPEDVAKCYNLLTKISDEYELVEKRGGADMGSRSWYGMLDDGVNPPKFILLSEEGDWKRTNTDKNAKKIMEILEKVR